MSDPEFTLLGDAIWLDFINTARGSTAPATDRLPDAAAYHRWTKALKLRSDADTRPFEEVRRLRDALTALAESLDAGQRPPAPAVSLINQELRAESGSQQLLRIGGEWRIDFAAAEPPAALAAVARSAAATLAEPLVFVRQCAAAACSHFLGDDSVNQGRRWCNSETCGRDGWTERRRGLLR